jgi:hypothetical protein
MIHVTGTTAVSLPPAAGIRLTVNAALTGTYTLVDGLGVTQAVVTNPTVGNTFTYYGLIGTLSSPATLTASATGDATISILSRTIA